MFTKSQITIKPLIDYLREQNMLLDNVADVLVKEGKALEKRDLVAIEELAEKKSELMLNIQANDQRIKLHPDVEELKTTYADHVALIRQKLEACKKKNIINGKLIDMSIASCRRLTSVMMDLRDKNTKNMTYTDKGTTIARGLAIVNLQA